LTTGREHRHGKRRRKVIVRLPLPSLLLQIRNRKSADEIDHGCQMVVAANLVGAARPRSGASRHLQRATWCSG
jgi:hypothetical protein